MRGSRITPERAIMTVRKTSKVWLGIGAAALLGSGVSRPALAADPAATPAVAAPNAAVAIGGNDHAGHDSAVPAAKATQGGEGGENGGAGLDRRVKFFRDMSLIHGHLLVGDEFPFRWTG